MFRAGSGAVAGSDFCVRRHECLDRPQILVVDVFNRIDAEVADSRRPDDGRIRT